jgi:conjugative transfer signal peptidase TraF
MEAAMTRLVALACASVGVAMLVGSTFGKNLKLVYNASDSAPRGFYVVRQVAQLRVGDYVVARLPDSVAGFAAKRGYLPRAVPVLKQIAAVGGQLVCVRNDSVYIDARVVARTLEEDGQRRELRAWNGCRRLLPEELFLLNPSNPASFDSRYLGPVDMSFILGQATRW